MVKVTIMAELIPYRYPQVVNKHFNFTILVLNIQVIFPTKIYFNLLNLHVS